MTAAGKQWQALELPVASIQRHASFQMRALGVDRTWVNRLGRVLKDGGNLPPIRVARVGKALYVVDGFHRLEAHERDGRETIGAEVAKMSLAEAREEALVANTTHGKGLSAADKAKAFAELVAAGGHLDARGALKPSRTIAAEMNYIYSHESIRKKLKRLGIEIDEAAEFPHGFKAYGDDEAAMALELADEARGHLEDFRELFYSLPEDDQRALLGTARDLVGALQIGERPERRPVGALPDI